MASVLEEKNGPLILEHLRLDESVRDSVIEIGKMALPEEDHALELHGTQEPGSTVSELGNCRDTKDLVTQIIAPTAEDGKEFWETNPELDCSTPKSEESKDVSDALIDKLTSGILTSVVPEQENLKKQISDITHSQSVLIETIEHENSKFKENQAFQEVAAIMDKARLYQLKLVNIKKEMMSLHEKTSQLKRRALKLQQQKQKEALTKEQKCDEELEKEKKLMAKVVLRKT